MLGGGGGGRWPSAALIVSVIALVVAVGGTALAGAPARLARVITGKQIKNGSIGSADIHNNNLLLKDFKRGQRSKLVGPRGSQGSQGSQGPKGDIGPSTAYHSTFAYLPAGTALPGSGFTTLHTLNLPPGSYLVLATADVSNAATGENGAVCDLESSTGDGTRFAAEGAQNVHTDLAGTLATTLTTAGSVHLDCSGNVVVGGDERRHQSSLSAIKVGQVVTQ
jgi:hypothetical protein